MLLKTCFGLWPPEPGGGKLFFYALQIGMTCYCSQGSQKATSGADPQGLWDELVSPLEDCCVEQTRLPVLEYCSRPAPTTLLLFGF